jgi:hypothetical protein
VNSVIPFGKMSAFEFLPRVSEAFQYQVSSSEISASAADVIRSDAGVFETKDENNCF